MKHAFCLFFVVIVCAFLSCKETKGVDTVLKEMLSKHVELRFDKMICYINGKDTIGYTPNDYKYLLIVNVDSTGCTPCSVSRLSQWKEWIGNKLC